MENIKVKTKFNFKTFKVANLYILNVKRKTYLVSIVLAAICLAAGIYSLCFSKEDNNLFLGVAFIVLAAFPVYSLLSIGKKIDKSISKFFEKNPAYTQYLEFTDESVVLVAMNNGNLEKAVYDWAYVQEINVLKDYYLLFLNGNIPLIVSRNQDDIIEGSQEKLAELMQEKGMMKPYRVYEKEIIKNFVDPVTYLEEEVEDLEAVLAKFAEPVVTVEENVEETPAEEAEVVEELEETVAEEAEVVEEIEEETEDKKEE